MRVSFILISAGKTPLRLPVLQQNRWNWTLSDFENEKLVNIIGGRINILNQRKLETLLN